MLVPHFPWGGFLSRICNNSSMGRLINAEASGRARPEFAGYDDPAFLWMCSAWPVPMVESNPTLAAVGVPTFVGRTDLSPRQSASALDYIRAGIPTLRVFEVHVPTPAGVLRFFPLCFSDLRAAFERDPTGPLDTAGCERQESKIAFVTPTG